MSRGVRLRRISFGSTSAVVTSIGLVVAFATTRTSRGALMGSLLIIGIADNLADSLSVHLYQEAEGLDRREALASTVTNFLARLAIASTFVALVAMLSDWWLIAVATVWGLAVLGALTVSLARQRNVSARRELLRHFAVVVAVVVLSRTIGSFITAHVD